MREAVSSAIGLPWAASVLALQQTARVVAGAGPARASSASYYAATQAAVDELDDITWALFSVGDELQDELVDLAADFITLDPNAPAKLAEIAMRFLTQSRDGAAVLLTPRSAQAAWQQARNNLQVFNLVKSVRTSLGIRPGDRLDLAALAARAYGLGAYAALWAIEGLGHDYAAARWLEDGVESNILPDMASHAPAASQTMLHAGLGLAFAERLLKEITPVSTPSEVERVLARFVALCRDNSMEGYAGAAFESLGLVARTWHPHVVRLVDAQLPAVDEDVPPYFWHGVGRALYFLPLYIIPGITSPWREVDREPPHEMGRLNARAGLAWATSLVNLRHPMVVEELLRRHGAVLGADDGFANGVLSSLIVRRDMTPDDPGLEIFGGYEPNPHEHEVRRWWHRLVTTPCGEASRLQPALRRARRLDQAFKYSPLEALVGELQQSRSAGRAS